MAMVYTSSQLLSFEEFLARYGEDSRYELADGELIEMEPTGPHEMVAGKVATRVGTEIDRSGYPWFVPKSCILRPMHEVATARRPDVAVIDERALSEEPLWEYEPVITQGRSSPLVVEVVSTNWENDYARKLEEYAFFGILEYWIVDFRGLGGVAYIGRPKQPTFTVCQLVGEDYQQTQFRLTEPIVSLLFPELKLTLQDLMPREFQSQ
jgi:Uma2 family endonuclease